MKQNIFKISVIIGFICIVYLCFSFVLWDFNPNNWPEPARFLCAFIWFMAVVFGVPAIKYFKEDF